VRVLENSEELTVFMRDGDGWLSYAVGFPNQRDAEEWLNKQPDRRTLRIGIVKVQWVKGPNEHD
jgi:hypothetical protein